MGGEGGGGRGKAPEGRSGGDGNAEGSASPLGSLDGWQPEARGAGTRAQARERERRGKRRGGADSPSHRRRQMPISGFAVHVG